MAQDMVPQILIVDDSADIRAPLDIYLQRSGFRTLQAESAAQARRILARATVHLMILDVMMPGEDGLTFLHSLDRDKRVPVILLTARASDHDRITGLDIGADDYVTKPFNPRELLSRIHAVLRRAPPLQPAPTARRRHFAGMVHEPDLQRLQREDGSVVALTTGENRLLDALLTHPGKVLSRAHLVDLVRGRTARENDRAADNIVSRLRRKIGDDAREAKLIVTEWGGGYRLAAAVETGDLQAGA